jgi:hypothetical protein
LPFVPARVRVEEDSGKRRSQVRSPTPTEKSEKG